MKHSKLYPTLTAIGLASLATLLTACGTISTIPIAESVRSRIHVVSVDSDVKLPPEMTFMDQGQGAALMLGGPIIGSLIANNSASTPKAQLSAEMQANHIVLGDILAAEFAKQASANSTMKFVVNDATADARVHLIVNAYGVMQAQPFGSTLYPLINVSAVMKAPDGTVIWQAMEVAGPHHRDNNEGHTYEDYTKDPELLRQVLISCSGIASRMLANNLMGQEKAQNSPGIQQ